MKTLKKIGIVLLVIIAIPLVGGLFAKKDFKSEREIIINKPKQEVFNYIKYVKNQDNFGKWQLSDPNLKRQYEGEDGTVGFKYTWESKELGNGSQTITNIVEGERLESDLYFGFGDAAHAYFILKDAGENQTLVTWGITGRSPYPWNFLSLVMSLFYDMGDDFDEGLKNLKNVLETQPTTNNSTTMKKLQFKTDIKASAEKVYKTMLGIGNIKTYEKWTAAFNPTSTYEGNWDKGSKMLFIGTGEDGKRGGMVSEIEDNIPNKFVSIRHYGIVNGDKEITTGAEVEKWTGGHENYSFEENNGTTTVTIEVDVTADFIDYYNSTCPQALAKLKAICESK